MITEQPITPERVLRALGRIPTSRAKIAL